MSHLTSGNLQVLALALATAVWILAVASMGQSDWRVWHLVNTTSIFSSDIAWVGIWKACFYGTFLFFPQGRSAKICHVYSVSNTFLPWDFRAVQHIFLFGCILGVMAKAYVIIALRSFYTGDARRSTTANAFTVGGFFYSSAGICILICAIWNFHSVSQNKSITFPVIFYIPPRPKAQEIGNAVIVAILSAVLMLLAGVFFLSYKFHMDSQVHPMIIDRRWTSSSET
ncbi:claudin-20 [Phascolarctos cinereus]|uniref:Claudin-34 n=1 Tax=Phascolarctos cinereus TaxID=38626 RepID=A0A6P5M109_PHACI|nr:claudin-34 [Phascolarctos cinereus]